MYFTVKVSSVPTVTTQTVAAVTWANFFPLQMLSIQILNSKIKWQVDPFTSCVLQQHKQTVKKKTTDTSSTWHKYQFTAVGLYSSNSFIKKYSCNRIIEQKASLFTSLKVIHKKTIWRRFPWERCNAQKWQKKKKIL